MVVFRHKWLYSCKVVVIGQKWLYSGKSCCTRAEWSFSDQLDEFEQRRLYSGKVVVFR